MERGTLIHESVEKYVKREQDMLHPDIHETYGQFFDGLRTSYRCFPEHPFGLTYDGVACDYDDPNVWFRGYLDLKMLPMEGEDGELNVYEFKTGGIYEDNHSAQRVRYGTAALAQHLEFPHVKVTTIYFDKKDIRQVTYSRAMFKEHMGALHRQAEMIEKDVTFMPKPNYTCRFCRFSRYNNGPCQF